MTNAVGELYEALLGREVDRLPSIVNDAIARSSAVDLWAHLTRFSLLAAAPTEHSMHAMLATIGARAYLNSPELSTNALTSVAAYLSVSRLPWSEAPILEPLREMDPPTAGELADAAQTGNREKVEDLLNAALDDRGVLLSAALLVDDEFFHPSIATDAILDLLRERPDMRREAVRALAVIWAASKGVGAQSIPAADAAAAEYCDSRGSVAQFHRLLAAVIGGKGDPKHVHEASLLGRVSYNLAKDYGALFMIGPIAEQLSLTVGDTVAANVITAALDNLTNGASYEEWLYA